MTDRPCPHPRVIPDADPPKVVPRAEHGGQVVQESGTCPDCGASFVRIARVREFTPWRKAG